MDTKIMLGGVCASKGVAEGGVYIVSDEKLGLPNWKDFILVCKQTNPAYSLLLMKSKGVITEVGGIVSHAAIISRELCIPCMVGVPNAVALFKDGQKIKLDTTNGVVYV